MGWNTFRGILQAAYIRAEQYNERKAQAAYNEPMALLGGGESSGRRQTAEEVEIRQVCGRAV